MSEIVCTSGYFNPLHKGHIRLLQNAKRLAESGNGKLVVIVNNDHQVKLKGSKKFMNQEERLEVVRALACVDFAVLSVDTDRTVRKTLKMVRPTCFAKGGDSTPENTPELKLCKDLGIQVVFGVGGGKVQSSSNLKGK